MNTDNNQFPEVTVSTPSGNTTSKQRTSFDEGGSPPFSSSSGDLTTYYNSVTSPKEPSNGEDESAFNNVSSSPPGGGYSPPPPGSTFCVDIPVSEIFSTVAINVDCEITSLDSRLTGILMAVGQRVTRVNDVSVSSRADIRQVIGLVGSEDDVVLELLTPRLELEMGRRSSSNLIEGEIDEEVGMHHDPPEEVLQAAMDEQKPGRCVIIVTQGGSCPDELFTMKARAQDRSIRVLDSALSMYQRPRHAEALVLIDQALQRGQWLVFQHATKSMSLLNLLLHVLARYDIDNSSDSVADSDVNIPGTAENSVTPEATAVRSPKIPFPADKEARIFIVMEPHPHFPVELLKHSVMLRYISREPSTTSYLRRTTSDDLSMQKRMIQMGMSVAESITQQDSLGSTEISVDKLVKQPKRGVKISSDVTVIEFENLPPEEVVVETPKKDKKDEEKNNKKSAENQKEFPETTGVSAVDEAEQDAIHQAVASGETISVENEFASTIRSIRHANRCFQGEKFTCLAKAGDGRIAAGSSEGNIYIMEYSLHPLLTFHAHPCAVWDIDFWHKHRLVSGAEDHTATEWVHDDAHLNPGFQGAVRKRFTSDVMAVKYLAGGTIVSGGMSGVIALLPPSGSFLDEDEATGGVAVPVKKPDIIPTISTVLCIDTSADHPNRFITGGGSGAVTVFDATVKKKVSLFSLHQGKVSALVCRNSEIFSTGSGEKSIAFTDCRSGAVENRIIGLPSTATAMAVRGYEVSACCGEALLIFDIRRSSSRHSPTSSPAHVENPMAFPPHRPPMEDSQPEEDPTAVPDLPPGVVHYDDALLHRKGLAWKGHVRGALFMSDEDVSAHKGTVQGEKVLVTVSDSVVRLHGYF